MRQIESGMLDPIKEINGVVLDSAHGFWWRICIWETLLALIVLGGFISGGKHPDYFFEAFLSSMLLIVIQLFICILIPSIIRLVSNKQHNKGLSVFVAIFSWFLMALYIVNLEKSFDIKVSGGGFISVLFPVAGYKIMRSVAGFSSVFWRIKKKGMAADNKFNESFGENVREENRSQVATNSDSLIREVICSDVSNNVDKENKIIESSTKNKWIVTLFLLISLFIGSLGGGLIVENYMENKAEDVKYEYDEKLRECMDLEKRVYFLLQKKYKHIDKNYFEKQKRENEIKKYLALDALTRDWEKFPEARQIAVDVYGEEFSCKFEKNEYMRDRFAGEKVLETFYPSDGNKYFDALREYNRDHRTQLITPGVWRHFLSNREQFNYQP